MNDANVGGNRGDFAEEQNPFGMPETLGKSSGEKVTAEESLQSADLNKGLGETATSEVMKEIFGIEEDVTDNSEQPEVPEMVEVTEQRPLIADGTTEKKLGKIGVSLVGEKVDAEGIENAVKKITELPLYEQSAALDEAKTKMIYANFGWMIGNDDIGEIQAEEKAGKIAKAKDSAREEVPERKEIA